MKRIQFKNDWRYSRKGDVIEEGDGVAQILIARGIAEEVVPDEATEDTEQAEDTQESAQESTQEMGRDSALPDVHTRRLPGPNESTAQPLVTQASGPQAPEGQRQGRRGGRG